MADAVTPKLGLVKPEVGGSRNDWGAKLNLNMDVLDNMQPASGYTAADVLAKLLTVDGPGSTLDADTVDGIDSSKLASGLAVYETQGLPGLLLNQRFGRDVIGDPQTSRDMIGSAVLLQDGHAWRITGDVTVATKERIKVEPGDVLSISFKIARFSDPSVSAKPALAVRCLNADFTDIGIVNFNTGYPGFTVADGIKIFDFTLSNATGAGINNIWLTNTKYIVPYVRSVTSGGVGEDGVMDVFAIQWRKYPPGYVYDPNTGAAIIGGVSYIPSDQSQPGITVDQFGIVIDGPVSVESNGDIYYPNVVVHPSDQSAPYVVDQFGIVIDSDAGGGSGGGSSTSGITYEQIQQIDAAAQAYSAAVPNRALPPFPTLTTDYILGVVYGQSLAQSGISHPFKTDVVPPWGISAKMVGTTVGSSGESNRYIPHGPISTNYSIGPLVLNDLLGTHSIDDPVGIQFASVAGVTTGAYRGVCYSPALKLLCAVGDAGLVATSPDGTTWTVQTSGNTQAWQNVCWSPERAIFLAVSVDGTQRVMTSPNGITWTLQTVPVDASPQAWAGICWSPELMLFCAVANAGGTVTTDRVMTSPDGITWTIRTAAQAHAWQAICWGGPDGAKVFVAISSTTSVNHIMSSPDGITWTTRPTGSISNLIRDVCWSPDIGLFVAVCSSGTGNRVFTSPDGITWTAQTSASDADWYGVAWISSLGMFVAVATGNSVGNRAMYSRDGITWALRATPEDNAWNAVCGHYDLGIVVALATTGTISRVMRGTVYLAGDRYDINYITAPTSGYNGENFSVGSSYEIFKRINELRNVATGNVNNCVPIGVQQGFGGETIAALTGDKNMPATYFSAKKRCQSFFTQFKDFMVAQGNKTWQVGWWTYNQGQADATSHTPQATYYASMGVLKSMMETIFNQAVQPPMFIHQTAGHWVKGVNEPFVPNAQRDFALATPGVWISAPTSAVPCKMTLSATPDTGSGLPLDTDINGHLDGNGSRWLGAFDARLAARLLWQRKNWEHMGIIKVLAKGDEVVIAWHCPEQLPIRFRNGFVGYRKNTITDKGVTFTQGGVTYACTSQEIVGRQTIKFKLATRPNWTSGTPVVISVGIRDGTHNIFESTTPDNSRWNYKHSSRDYSTRDPAAPSAYEVGVEADVVANLGDLDGKPYDLSNMAILESRAILPTEILS